MTAAEIFTEEQEREIIWHDAKRVREAIKLTRAELRITVLIRALLDEGRNNNLNEADLAQLLMILGKQP